MKETASRIIWKGTVARRHEAEDLLQSPGDTVMVVRGRPRLIVLLCPCGCGDEIVINVDENAGPAWSVFNGGANPSQLTLYPSIWRDTGCGSHFIVWEGRILGARQRRASLNIEPPIIARVGNALSPRGRHFSEIAQELSENPWSVLWACRQLVHEGKALEDPDQGVFHLAAPRNNPRGALRE